MGQCILNNYKKFSLGINEATIVYSKSIKHKKPVEVELRS